MCPRLSAHQVKSDFLDRAAMLFHQLRAESVNQVQSRFACLRVVHEAAAVDVPGRLKRVAGAIRYQELAGPMHGLAGLLAQRRAAPSVEIDLHPGNPRQAGKLTTSFDFMGLSLA